jgi:hypothetical protein
MHQKRASQRLSFASTGQNLRQGREQKRKNDDSPKTLIFREKQAVCFSPIFPKKIPLSASIYSNRSRYD